MTQVFAWLTRRDILVLSQLFIMVLHWPNMPWWLMTLGVVLALSQCGRLRTFLYRHTWVERTVQLLAFFGGMAGIWLLYRTFFGVEAGVAFLLLCLMGKLLELKARRDEYVLLTLGLFVIAGLFLFDQNLTTTILALLGVIASLYAMIAQNDHGAGRIRTLFWLCAQATPLMVILFLFFPRLPPLWSVQLNSSQAKTGMTDSISPGDIAELSQSSELAFRVIFEGAAPAKPELYWRGLVLGRFDGKTWRPIYQYEYEPLLLWRGGKAPAWVDASLTQDERQAPRRYQLILEPTQQQWLFALSVPYSNDRGVGLTRDFTLQTTMPTTQRQTFRLLQVPTSSVDVDLPDDLRQAHLQLPASGNPQSRLLATALMQKVDQDPVRYANAILQWIRQQNFHYTLKPPPLREHRIDEFLFQTRRGFCEHYSSSYVFLLRAAGIPARVVVGYQGGERGRDGRSLEVRQRDAHAWTEAWFAGRGWVRIDPTAAIAPERIEQGMDALTEDAALFGDDAVAQLQYQQFKLVKEMRELADYASYLWQRDIVGFDQNRQQDQLLRWFGLKSMWTQILWMIAGLVLILAAVVLRLWWKRRPVWHPLDQPLMQLSHRLRSQGLDKQLEEGMLDWLQRVAKVAAYREQALKIAQLYAQARYTPEAEQMLSTYQRALKKLVKEWANKPKT